MSSVRSLLKRIPQYTRSARHLRSLLQHGTVKKWANVIHAEYERFARKIELNSRPYLLIIDPCNYCNLRCPLCPTGRNELGRPQGMMSFECFRRYFDQHSPYAFEVYLHNWGESLINKDVYKMIEYAQRHNVGTNLSSNLVIINPSDMDKLLDSGLEYLVVSLDGVDQESYSQYRVRGDYERVVKNLRELIKRRNARGQKTPIIEWQYIIMRHNQNRVQEAEALAKEIGVDLLRFIPVGLPYDAPNRKELAAQWFPTSMQGRKEGDDQQQFGQSGRPGPCFYLYRSMVINPDGGISPCCVVYRKDRDFAHSQDNDCDVAGIWNNAHYQSARSLFSSKEMPERPRTVCDTCNIFTWHKSKASHNSELEKGKTAEIYTENNS